MSLFYKIQNTKFLYLTFKYIINFLVKSPFDNFEEDLKIKANLVRGDAI